MHRPFASYGAVMAHGHPWHAHGARGRADSRALARTLALIAVFIAAEVTIGVIAHSLALLSDAGHLLADAAALGFSIVALTLAARPAEGALTFGYKRVEILSAQANGVSLLILAAFITYEAINRLLAPPAVRAGLVLALALLGVLVNLVAARMLADANQRSLGVQGSFQHLLTDLYGFIGTALAAAVILLTGFQRADPIASLCIAGLMARAAYLLLKASGRVFLEAAPEGLDPGAIGRALVALPSVVEVHDLHVWEVTSGFPALSAHVLVASEQDCHAARRDMEAMLHARFGLDHTTLQVDHAGGDLLEIQPAGGSVRAPAGASAAAAGPSGLLIETPKRKDE